VTTPAPLPAPATLRWIADVLDERRTVHGQAERNALVDRLRALADGRLAAGSPEAGELRAALALLARSSLGTPEIAAAIAEVETSSVAGVLDTVAAPDGQFGSAVVRQVERSAVERRVSDPTELTSPSDVWRGELQQLLAIDRRSPADVAAALSGDGVRLSPDDVLDLPTDPAAAAALLARLGYRFDEDGFCALHAAALRARHTPPPRAETVSGLESSRRLDPADVLTEIGAVPPVLGRMALIRRLADRLSTAPAPVQVLRGGSGYGKSTVALAVAQRVHDEHGVTALRLPAADLDTLVDGLHRAASWGGATVAQLTRALSATGAERAERLWRLLDAAPQRWLAVLEDAGADAVGHHAWSRPSPTGNVLITTEHGDPAAWGAEVTELGELDERDGEWLVLRHFVAAGGSVTTTARARARALSNKLAGSPLALDRIGSVLGTGPDSPTLAELTSGHVDTGGVLPYAYGVCLRAVAPALRDRARRTLLVLAMLAPDEPVPVDLLTGPDDEDTPTLLAELVRVGLVEELEPDTRGRHRIRLHRTVTAWARGDSSGADRSAALVAAVGLLERDLDRHDPGRPSSWRFVDVLEPHVAEVVEHPGPHDGALSASVMELARRCASALAQAGRQVGAETLLDRALHRIDGVGPRQRARLDALHTRAWLTAAEGHGDLAAAEEELWSLLDLQRSVLAPDDPSVLTTRDTLAWLAAEQGRTAEAETELRAVLDVRAVAGREDRDTLSTRQRLAWVVALRGREGEALAEFADVLRARRVLLGEQHMHVYISRYRHAWALRRIGQSAQAEQEYRALCDDLVAALGRQHPMTLIVRSKCAWMMRWTARADDAARVYAELLDDQAKVFGVDHPRTVAIHHDLGCLALQRGQLVEAIGWLDEAVRMRTELSGVDHHRTLESRSELAWAELQRGRVPRAYRESLAVLLDRTRVLGAEHPGTLISRHLVCRCLIRLGRLGEAEHALRRLVEHQERVLSPANRNLLHARHSLGYTIALRGRPAEGERLLRDVLADRTRHLGPQHRETMVTLDVLTWLMGRSGRAVDALEICVQLLADRTEVMGPDHPHTLTSRYRRAWLIGVAGGTHECRAQLRELLRDLHATLGPDHPDTLRCRMALMRQERRHGDLTAALAEAGSLADDQERVQGAYAVDTLRAREERGIVLHMLGRSTEARVVLRSVFDTRVRVFGPAHPDTERGYNILTQIG
jgi:tetratricopeptide (TPR) repeat protein